MSSSSSDLQTLQQAAATKVVEDPVDLVRSGGQL
jgi:hypothetical protein